MVSLIAFALIAQTPPPITLYGSPYPPPPVLRPKLPHPKWPPAVPGDGLKPYTPTRISQRIAVTDGRPSHQWYDLNRDDVFQNAPTMFNPNRQTPWRVSGGMEGMHGWKSLKLTNVAKSDVKVWRENLPIAGAGRNLPGFRWQFPEGATFADLLVNDKDEPFELRMRTKKDGKWRAQVVYENAAAAPHGYLGAAKCASCHDHAGSSKQYGIMVRGDDTVFSFNPMQ